MAKKKSKINKETRRVIEAISDICKERDGKVKFKGVKKKQLREIKKTCAHWTIRKGKEHAAVSEDPERPGNFRCRICGASFPIEPLSREEYSNLCSDFLAIVNQSFFHSVHMGGDADDTKVLLTLKRLIPKYRKVALNITKALNKRQEYEDRKANRDTGSQFGNYSSYSHRFY